MSRELPPQPNLRNLKNQAKTMLKAHGRGDSSVCETLRRVRRFAEASDADILSAKVTLTDVQYALAMDYGFASWNKLKEHVDSVAGEAMAARVAELVEKARAVYTAKGPAHDSTGSDWDMAGRRLLGEFLDAGEAGYLADLELSRSENAGVRRQVAVHFGVRRDARSTEELVRMLQDRSNAVRRQALRWYAAAIHPARLRDPVGAVPIPASRIPVGLEPIVAMANDANPDVRLMVVHALASYARLGDAEVDGVLRSALDDPKHKVHHAAARALQVPCPGCGAAPDER